MTFQEENTFSRTRKLDCGRKCDFNGAFNDGADIIQCLAEFSCKWFGPVGEILLHCQQFHPDKIWYNGEKEKSVTVHDVLNTSYRIELVVAHSNLFWLHIKNDVALGSLYVLCQHISRKDDDLRCRFVVRIDFKDLARLSTISCSTEVVPHTEDIQKILNSEKYATKSLSRLTALTNDKNDISFVVSISKLYYYLL